MWPAGVASEDGNQTLNDTISIHRTYGEELFGLGLVAGSLAHCSFSHLG